MTPLGAGIGGIWGGIATGIFASKVINTAGANGLINGNIILLRFQLIAIVATVAYSALMTFIILKGGYENGRKILKDRYYYIFKQIR